MQCPRCNALVEEGTVFCGNCGQQLNAQKAVGATLADPVTPTVIAHVDSNRGNSPVNNPSVSNPSGGQRPTYNPYQTVSETQPTIAPSNTPPVGNVSQPGVSGISNPPRRNLAFIVLIGALVLLIIAGSAVGIAAYVNNNKTATTGGNATATATATTSTAVLPTPNVFYADSQAFPGHTDTLRISITGLNALAAGSQYNAWLIDEANEKTFALGKLIANGQKYELSYGGDGKGTNLLGLGNKVIVTIEQGDVQSPTGKTVLAGSFPPQAFVHIKHLLFQFDTTPNNTGLLVGTLDQSGKLYGAANSLVNAVANANQSTIKCATQSIVDIIEGSQGADYKSLANKCPSYTSGDGFGLLGDNGYIATAKAHTSLAATQTDTTETIRIHAGHVQIALDNINGWLATINQDALNILNNPNDTGKVGEIRQLASNVLNGIDLNNDEQVDPVKGEAGAVTAYAHAHLMATITLKPVNQA